MRSRTVPAYAGGLCATVRLGFARGRRWDSGADCAQTWPAVATRRARRARSAAAKASIRRSRGPGRAAGAVIGLGQAARGEGRGAVALAGLPREVPAQVADERALV